MKTQTRSVRSARDRAAGRRRTRTRRVLAVTGAALLVGTSAASATGTNGSFEQGQDISGGFVSLPAGSQAIASWEITSGTVDYVNDSYWQAADGARSVDLNGGGPGAVSHSFSTLVGATYGVTFDLSANPDSDDHASRTLTVSATGAFPETYAYDTVAAGNSRAEMMYAEHGYVFVATSTSTTLTFTSTVPGAYGPVIDDVVIVETLPTASDCKKDGWTAMTDTYGLPFKNQGDCVSHFATDLRNLGDG